MKENEFIKILNIEPPAKELITAKHLKNKEDRTLIYGYDCDRNTFHVYLKDEQIHILKYNSREVFPKLEAFSNDDYVPNKRVYPEYSDFEFCKLLKEQDIHISFLSYSEPAKEPNPYFGKII